MTSLFASSHEFWYGGARYRLSHAWQADGLGGRRLSGSVAERVLARVLHDGGEHSLRSAYRTFAEASDLSRISNEQMMRWFSAALGGELGGIGLARLVLLELGADAVLSQPGGARVQSDAERLAARCMAAGIRDLVHHGRVYRLVVEAQPAPSMHPDLANTLRGERAATLLTELAANEATPVPARDLLQEVARFMSSTTRSVASAALVLRHFPRGGAGAGETVEPPRSLPSQRSTPSQLRRAPAPPRQTTDWVELRLIDDAGQPIAAQAFRVTFADGSTRQGTLDDTGTTYLDGVPPGVCTVEFPGFSAHAVS